MLRYFGEELAIRAKFPATTCGYSMAKVASLDDAFSDVSERKATPVEGQSPLKEISKGEK